MDVDSDNIWTPTDLEYWRHMSNKDIELHFRKSAFTREMKEIYEEVIELCGMVEGLSVRLEKLLTELEMIESKIPSDV